MKCLIIIFGLLITNCCVNAQEVGNFSFENWHSAGNFMVPDSFRTKDQVTFNGNPSVTRSNESHSGQFAVAIQTIFLSPGVGMSGQINYGSMLNNSGAMTFFGHPFSSRPDMLKFWYKYSRNGNDTAQASVTLTRWTNQREIIGSGVINLTASSNSYTSAEINILYFSGNTPDTISISFVSSSNLVPSFGTTLYVDDISFDQPTLLRESSAHYVDVFPNPTSDICSITFDRPGLKTCTFYDMQGRLMSSFSTIAEKSRLDLSGFQKGMYYLFIQNNDRIDKSIVIKQ